MLSDAELDALEALHAEATPGPWEGCYYQSKCIPDLRKVVADCCDAGSLRFWFAAQEGNQDLITAGTGNGPTSEKNLAHVVSMHNALPALLAMAREAIRLRAEIKEGNARYQVYVDHVHRVTHNIQAKERRYIASRAEGAADCYPTDAEKAPLLRFAERLREMAEAGEKSVSGRCRR